MNVLFLELPGALFLPMAAQSNGLQNDADFAFYFLDFAEAVRAWVKARAAMFALIAQHGWVQSPSLKALGMLWVCPTCARPALASSPLPARKEEFKTTLEAVFFQARTCKDDLAKSRTAVEPLVRKLLASHEPKTQTTWVELLDWCRADSFAWTTPG